MSRYSSTRVAGLLLGLFALLVEVTGPHVASPKGKHRGLPTVARDDKGSLADELAIVHVLDLTSKPEELDPTKVWEVLIVYKMHGKDGSTDNPVSVTKTHMVHKDTTFAHILGHEDGLHSHASVVGMLRQMDHKGELQAEIEAIENAHKWCDDVHQGAAPDLAGAHKDCYNAQPAYGKYFHNKTILKLFLVTPMAEHTGTHKDAKGPKPDQAAALDPSTSGQPIAERDTVVHFIQQHRSDIAGGGTHYLDQQVALLKKEKGNRIGTIILVAYDDDHSSVKKSPPP